MDERGLHCRMKKREGKGVFSPKWYSSYGIGRCCPRVSCALNGGHRFRWGCNDSTLRMVCKRESSETWERASKVESKKSSRHHLALHKRCSGGGFVHLRA